MDDGGLFSGLLKLKPEEPPAAPDPNAEVPPEAESVFAPNVIPPPVEPPAFPNKLGFGSPEDAAFPKRLVPGAFPVLDPNRDGLDESEGAKREFVGAPEEDGVPNENFGGSGIAMARSVRH